MRGLDKGQGTARARGGAWEGGRGPRDLAGPNMLLQNVVSRVAIVDWPRGLAALTRGMPRHRSRWRGQAAWPCETRTSELSGEQLGGAQASHGGSEATPVWTTLREQQLRLV